MRIRDLNWMQLEAYLVHDDRIVLPMGSTEQHAYLSLETDNLLAAGVAVEAAEPDSECDAAQPAWMDNCTWTRIERALSRDPTAVCGTEEAQPVGRAEVHRERGPGRLGERHQRRDHAALRLSRRGVAELR